MSLLPLPWLEATWFKMLPSKYKADMSYYCNPHLKNTTMKYTMLLILSALGFGVNAQDTLVLNDGKKMPVKVIELAEDGYHIEINGRQSTIMKGLVKEWVKADLGSFTTVNATLKVDKFDNSKSASSDVWVSFGKDASGRIINGNMTRLDNGLIIVNIFYTGDLGCMSQYSSKMKVKLVNGDIIEFLQASSTDCGSSGTSFIPLNTDEVALPNYGGDLSEQKMATMLTSPWEIIRIEGTEHTADLTPNRTREVQYPEQFFSQHLLAVNNSLGIKSSKISL